jgi:hypothetical protein
MLTSYLSLKAAEKVEAEAKKEKADADAKKKKKEVTKAFEERRLSSGDIHSPPGHKKRPSNVSDAVSNPKQGKKQKPTPAPKSNVAVAPSRPNALTLLMQKPKK